MGIIKIEPAKVEENAAQIEKLGKNMLTKMGEVNQKVKSLREVWKDNIQTDYDSEFSNLYKSFESFMEVIPKYAKEARDHAEAMRRHGG